VDSSTFGEDDPISCLEEVKNSIDEGCIDGDEKDDWLTEKEFERRKQVPMHQVNEVGNFFLVEMVDGGVAGFFPHMTSSSLQKSLHICFFQE